MIHGNNNPHKGIDSRPYEWEGCGVLEARIQRETKGYCRKHVIDVLGIVWCSLGLVIGALPRAADELHFRQFVHLGRIIFMPQWSTELRHVLWCRKLIQTHCKFVFSATHIPHPFSVCYVKLKGQKWRKPF